MTEQPDRDPECERCGEPYHVRPGCEPTRYCDPCAHIAVEELIDSLALALATLKANHRWHLDNDATCYMDSSLEERNIAAISKASEALP